MESKMKLNLEIDPLRSRKIVTGIYVRAKTEQGTLVVADIADLKRESLLAWLRSDGGENPLAENIVGILLNYGHLNEK